MRFLCGGGGVVARVNSPLRHFSLRFCAQYEIEKSLPLEYTGFWPVSCSNTRAARVNLSPDSPTQQLITNLSTLMSRITLLFLSAWMFDRHTCKHVSTVVSLGRGRRAPSQSGEDGCSHAVLCRNPAAKTRESERAEHTHHLVYLELLESEFAAIAATCKAVELRTPTNRSLVPDVPNCSALILDSNASRNRISKRTLFLAS